MTSAAGIAVLIFLAWLMSEDRRRIDWRLVAIAIGLQFALALLVLRTAFGQHFFEAVRAAFSLVTRAAGEGSHFVFGALDQVIVFNPGTVSGAEGPFVLNAVLAFQVLPVVIVVASISAMLYHLRIIQVIVRALAWLMRRTLRTSGAETFAAAIQIFLGIEGMPAIKGYLARMTRSELATVTTAFMGGVAADVMVIYASFGAQPGHLLAASIMSAPAAILFAKIFIPETEVPATRGAVSIEVPVESKNIIDAAARGASDGLTLALNIGALLIAFVSLVFLLNGACTAIFGLSFSELMGWAFRPFAFVMGVPAADVPEVARLLGTKSVLNEFIAYTDMQTMIAAGQLQPRSIMIATYALCGFANPGSLGILIACMNGLIPERRAELARIGLVSLVAGTFATFTTACIAGVIG